jgi:hypothetical protein
LPIPCITNAFIIQPPYFYFGHQAMAPPFGLITENSVI